jgi:hypothetical protein
MQQQTGNCASAFVHNVNHEKHTRRHLVVGPKIIILLLIKYARCESTNASHIIYTDKYNACAAYLHNVVVGPGVC